MERYEFEFPDMLEREGAPVVKLVALLLMQMAEMKSESLILPRDYPELHTKIMPAVTNRLKVMCGLNPVFFPEAREGDFQIRTRQRTCLFRVAFHDAATPKFLEIRQIF